MSRLIDIIKPEPSTAQEAYTLWKEWVSGRATIAYGRSIEITYVK